MGKHNRGAEQEEDRTGSLAVPVPPTAAGGLLGPELCIQLLVAGSGQQRAVPSLPCDLGAQEKAGPGLTRVFGGEVCGRGPRPLDILQWGWGFCAAKLGLGAQGSGTGPLSVGEGR